MPMKALYGYTLYLVLPWLKKLVEKHSIVATIDDCECFECECKRRPIDMLSTILVHLPTEYGMVTQRLTPSEAKALANALTSYANDINEFRRNYKMAKGKDFMRRNIQIPKRVL